MKLKAYYVKVGTDSNYYLEIKELWRWWSKLFILTGFPEGSRWDWGWWTDRWNDSIKEKIKFAKDVYRNNGALVKVLFKQMRDFKDNKLALLTPKFSKNYDKVDQMPEFPFNFYEK